MFQIFSETTGKVVENPVEKALRQPGVVGLANHTVLRAKELPDQVEKPLAIIERDARAQARLIEDVLDLPARVTPITPFVAPTLDSSQVLTNAGIVAPRLDGLRVLVVDDEADARALVREVLTAQGADVHIAGSAEKAIRMFALVRPHVLVSDIGMPITDGYSLIQQVRARPRQHGGNTPALALTAYVRGEDAARAIEAGYQMHLSKPVEPAHLVAVVAKLGGRAQE